MYKCSECSQIFKERPDFCDCGNDTFIEIIEDVKPQEKKEEPKEELVQYNSALKDNFKKNLPSVIFLIFCIILSFIILFFIGNPKDEPLKQKEGQKEEQKGENNLNLPDIDKIWNDEKPKQTQTQTVIQKPKTEPVIIAKEEAKIAKVELKKEPTVIKKPSQKTQQQPQKQEPKQTQQKTSQKAQPQIQKPQQKPQQKTQQQAQSSTKTSTKPAAQTKPQTSAQTTQPKAQTTTSVEQKPKQQTQQAQQQNIQVPAATKANSEELKQYKKALRNKIASNINFLNVAGDGKCVLSFNISQSGALLNRKFVSQSQNSSLNDAVYSAMLQVATFKAPPSGYKNETMKLTVQISGGNFSVSLE